jgi:hypothetical protein
MSQPEASKPPKRRSVLTSSLYILVLGAVIAPVAVYLFGSLLIAPYAGEGGLAGFLTNVYGDAARGEAAAWGLLLSPATLILTWWLVVRARRSMGRQRADAGIPSKSQE